MSAPEQAAVRPSLRDQLEAVLPSWTHWSGFIGFTATWTVPGGTWSITAGLTEWPTLTGPGGTWSFGRRDADHIIRVLRALGALSESRPQAESGDDVEREP